jgi:GAF domain-containing protein
MDASLRLLLVDDERSLREPLRDYFRAEYGFEVDLAACGAEARTCVEAAQGAYDVALLDHQLIPGPDGVTLMREIKARYPEIECIILTGWGAEQKLQALMDGAFRYIEKPFNKTELVMLIRSAALQVRLRATSRAILSQAAPEIVLQQIVASARALTLAEATTIELAAPLDSTGTAPLHYTCGLPDDSAGRSRQIKSYKTVLRAPIRSGNIELGTLNAYSRSEVRADSWGASAMLQTLADQASLAIAHAQAFQQVNAQASYMSSLVQVGQELTRAGSTEEQLLLAWQFVRQQLKVATFLVALYDAERDFLAFPLAMDEEEKKDLKGRQLGDDKRDWSVTGYVVKTGDELHWRTQEEKAAESKQLGIQVRSHGKPSQSLFCIPLRRGSERIGALSVQAYSSDAFSPAQLDACRALANLLVAALENSRLVADARRQARDLQLLQRYLTEINSSLDLQQVQERTCQTAVEFFGVDHSGLVLFDEDARFGTVAAEYPADLGTRGLRIPLAGVPDEERLAQEGRVVVADDVQHAAELGEVRDILHGQFAIQSILIVPVRSEQRVLGSFSLDSIRQKRRFTDFESDLCRLFADQVGASIKNAQVYEEARRRGKLLEALDVASRHIRAEKDPRRLMHEVVRLAAELLQCSCGALYTNEVPTQRLELATVDRLPHDLLPTHIDHNQGLVGVAAATGELQHCVLENVSVPVESRLAAAGFHMAVAAPLKNGAAVMGVLLLADKKRPQGCTAEDEEILRRFARQAVIALQTSQAMTKEQRFVLQYDILNQLSSRIVAAGDIDKILHISLTGVTAGYGLGYNRAALLLLDRSGERLVGRLGIGNIDEEDARRDWARDQQNEPRAFSDYLDRLDKGEVVPTPLDHRIRRLVLPLDRSSGKISQTIKQPTYHIVDRLDKLPEAFVSAFEPAAQLVIVPLVARDRAIGVLIADNKFTRSPITRDSIPALTTFANTAAIAIDNAQLYADEKRSREQLQSYYAASTALVSSSESKQILQDIVDHACRTAKAQRVGMVFFTQESMPWRFYLSGQDKISDIADIVRVSDGLSTRVLRTGERIAIEDTETTKLPINKSGFWREFRAALCLPITLLGRRIGVMWFYYAAPHEFTAEEIEANQLYVNHAAIAHDAVRRIEELGHMRQAAEAMSMARTPHAALQQIVDSAARVLEADSAALWSYDDVRDRFIPDELTVFNIPPEKTQYIRNTEPSPGHTTKRVMEQGYVAVTDIGNVESDFLGQPTRTFLKGLGVQAFHAVRLQVGEETLGVLYANYSEQRLFGDEQKITLETFATHAAQTLKTARLLAQLERTQRAVSVIAGTVVQDSLRTILMAIAQHTRQVLDADAVTLYAYDEKAKRFTHWGADIEKQQHPGAATPPDSLPLTSAPYRLLEIDYAPYYRVAEDNAQDHFLLGGNFTQGEGIRAAAGFLLRADQHNVGVLFVNFRSAHRFTHDEIATMQLFADQAAVAVRNSILYEEVSGLYRQAELVAQLTQEAAANLTLAAFLESLFGGLYRIYQARNIAIHPSLAIFDPVSQALDTYDTHWYPTDVRPSHVSIATKGIMAFVARTRMSHVAANVKDDPHYNPLLEKTRAEIAVPIFLQGELYGVLDLESPTLNAFTDEDRQFLETLAAQIAVTAHNVRQYEELVRTQKQMAASAAVAWVGMVSAQWRHSLETDVTTIRDSVLLLRKAINERAEEKIDQRLDIMERLASRVLSAPITAPLDPQKGVQSVSVSRLLRAHYSTYSRRERLAGIELALDCCVADAVTVRVNPDWLTQALDLLVNNAADALADVEKKQIRIGIDMVAQHVKVSVADTGPGIPPAVQQQMFTKPVDKQKGDKGMGVGLLLAQTILQTYQGDIHVAATGPQGTTIVFQLPCEL